MKTPETGSRTNPSTSDTNSIMAALGPEFASKTVNYRPGPPLLERQAALGAVEGLGLAFSVY
jgi:hypothetical protein